MKNNSFANYFSKKSTIIFIEIALVIYSILGFSYYYYEKQVVIEKIHHELESVSTIKKNLIKSWLEDLQNDAKFIFDVQYKRKTINQLISDQNNIILKNNFIEHYSSFVKIYKYENVQLVNINGEIIASIDSMDSVLNEETKKLVLGQSSLNIQFSNFYLKKNNLAYKDIIVPFFKADTKELIAYLIIKVDPTHYIFPLINSWRKPIGSIKTNLYQLEIPQNINLNSINHNLAYKINLDSNYENFASENSHSLKLVLGRFEGKDEKNEETFSYNSHIDGTDWILVIKISSEEALKEFQIKMILTFLFLGALMLLTSLFFYYTYKNNQKNIYQDLYNKELNLRISKEKFETTLYSIGEGIITTDENGLITQMNIVAEQLTGWNESEALGKRIEKVYKVVQEDSKSDLLSPLNKVLEYNQIVNNSNDIILISKEGTETHISQSCAPILDNNNELFGVVLIIRDQTIEIQKRKELEESEKFAKDILIKLNDAQSIAKIGSWELNLLDNTVWWSNELYEILEENKSDYLTTKEISLMFLENEIFQHFENNIQNSLDKNKSFNFEMPIKTNKGNNKYCHINGKGEYDSDGVVIKISAIVHDITERKTHLDLIKQSEMKFRSYIENAPVGVYLTNQSGTFVDVNSKGTEMLGYNIEEFLNLSILNIINPSTSESDLESFRNVINGSKISNDFCFIKNNGETSWFTIYTSKLDEDSYLTYALNIDEIKQNEIDLITAKDKAEEMNRLKNSFLANMSHELRTPMNGILGFTNLLMEETDIIEVNQVAKFINNSSKRLMETLNSILNLSKIESGHTKIDPIKFDLIYFLNERLNNYSTLAREKQLEFSLESNYSELIILLDQTLLNDIVNNLVNNAIKYTNEGFVKVNIDIIKNDIEELIQIDIIDSGIGIEEEALKYIFDEFRQASEGVERKFEGTGLGLTICRKYTKLLDGNLTVKSKINDGSTFTITLPYIKDDSVYFKIEKETTTKTFHNYYNSLKEMHILYVEDDEISIRYLLKIIPKSCKVLSAKKESEVMNILKENRIDLILMDINLGINKSGLYLTKLIKEIPEYAIIPIIACTAFAMQGDREIFIENGCDDYLSKPFEKENLLALLNLWIGLDYID